MIESKALNVIAIPFAGGDRYSYRHFQQYLSNSINLHTVELPGRGSRRKEAIPDFLEGMAENLIAQTGAIISRGPFALYGHSMGALLGYHIALILHAKKMPQPVWAFFSGCGAPGSKQKVPISHLESCQFWNRIAAHNGVPDPILNSEDLKAYFEPVLRHDFAALENYCNNFKESFRLDCPLIVRSGTEESISDREMLAWQKFSSKQIDQQTLKGDHFSYIKNPEAICNHMNDLTRNMN